MADVAERQLSSSFNLKSGIKSAIGRNFDTWNKPENGDTGPSSILKLWPVCLYDLLLQIRPLIPAPYAMAGRALY